MKAPRELLFGVPIALYAVVSWLRADLRVEHVLLLGIVVTMALVGPRSRELLRGLYPFALVAVLFDAMRPFRNVGLAEGRVLGCELRDFESSLFGWTSQGQRFTVHDWFVAHHTTALDLACAIPYATFILWCVSAGALFYVRDRATLGRFAWGFFGLNVAGFATYHLLPAAPPWYVHAHGCAIDLATRASEGPALARVDALLGVPWFAGMYGKASSVFGALPSLHCAYPLLVAIEGWALFGTRLRIAAIAYWLAMIFSAVYLDHHWLVDAILGSIFAVVVVFGIRVVSRIRLASSTSRFEEAT